MDRVVWPHEFRWQLRYLTHGPKEETEEAGSIKWAPANPLSLVILSGATEEPVVDIEILGNDGWRPIFYRIRAINAAMGAKRTPVQDVATVFGKARETKDGRVEGKLWSSKNGKVIDMPKKLYREGAIRHLIGS